jgi:hypothetical protein
VCLNAQQQCWATCPTKSVNAHEIETAVIQHIRGYYSTFAETLVIADKHTMCSGERSEFLELGRIQGNPMLVQSVRTPVFSKDGALEGTIGFGLDVSDRCDELFAQVRSWVSTGGAEELHPSVYLLKKRAADCELTEQFIENNIE